MDEELSVVGKVRMERETDQAFFVSDPGNAITDVQEDFCLGSLRVVLKDMNHAMLFNDKQSVVTRVTNMHRSIESKFRKRLLQANSRDLNLAGIFGLECQQRGHI